MLGFECKLSAWPVACIVCSGGGGCWLPLMRTLHALQTASPEVMKRNFVIFWKAGQLSPSTTSSACDVSSLLLHSNYSTIDCWQAFEFYAYLIHLNSKWYIIVSMNVWFWKTFRCVTLKVIFTWLWKTWCTFDGIFKYFGTLFMLVAWKKGKNCNLIMMWAVLYR